MTTAPNASRPQPQPRGSMLSRQPHTWMFLRIVLGVIGAALVLFPVASGNSYVFSIVGLVMFVVAILLVPAGSRATFQEKARELGVLAVVDGGRYRLPNSASSVAVQLFIAADRISVLDAKFRALLEIPTAEITSFVALQGEKGWFLELIWASHAAEFAYHGASAEGRAVEAEKAIRNAVAAPAPLVPQRRAAGA